MEEPSISLFCDDSYLCLLSNSSSSEESADNGTLMSDEKFAEELQFQEALMASIITSNTPRIDSPPKESKEAGESSKSFCKICAEGRENDQMFPIQNCGHSCCITCITKYIAANITNMGKVSRENSTVLTCPVGLLCEGVLEIDACREIVPKYLISMWDDAICESMIEASHKFYCPYKDCSSLMLNDSGDLIREAECLSCRRLLCVQCQVPWHSGIGCEEFKGMDATERGREDLLVHQIAKEKKWQRCPTCKFFVEKSEGCLHMTCRQPPPSDRRIAGAPVTGPSPDRRSSLRRTQPELRSPDCRRLAGAIPPPAAEPSRSSGRRNRRTAAEPPCGFQFCYACGGTWTSTHGGCT